MSDWRQSPLVQALAQVGRAWMEERVRQLCADLERAPAGRVLQAWQLRRAQIAAEGREINDQDVRAFCDSIPSIVEQVRAEERGAG